MRPQSTSGSPLSRLRERGAGGVRAGFNSALQPALSEGQDLRRDADRYLHRRFTADGEADRIADFTPGEDVIRLSGIDGGFAGLDIAAVGGALRIAAAGDVLWLEGVGADVLTADDFLFF